MKERGKKKKMWEFQFARDKVKKGQGGRCCVADCVRGSTTRQGSNNNSNSINEYDREYKQRNPTVPRYRNR